MKLEGGERLVLSRLLELQEASNDYVNDARMAAATGMDVHDVRDWLESLGDKGFVERARRSDGFSAYVTARGKQALRMTEPFPKMGQTGTTGGSVSGTLSRGIDLNVQLRGYMAASSMPPFGTGEPLRFAVDLTVVNMAESPVFVVEARLRSKSGQHLLDFGMICDEEKPLLTGARRSGTRKVENCVNDQFAYNLLRNVCRPDSIFEVATARGERVAYPATDVCDEQFLGWPIYIIDERTLDPNQAWFPDQPSTLPVMGQSVVGRGDVRRDLTPDDIETIRAQVWANVDSSGESSARCPVDGFPMKIKLVTDEDYDADITAYCERHGFTKIKKETDPLRPSYTGRLWTKEQIDYLTESSLMGLVQHCPICETVIRSRKSAGYISVNCLRCGGHGMLRIG